jgi:sarcosine oxidase
VDADAAVAALQAAAAAHGAVVRHHRRVESVVPAPDGGVLVHQATGATVRARSAIVAVGAWTSDVLGTTVRMPPLRVTQEQPAHFPALDPSVDWPAFTVDSVYGLASPGDGVKVGFHGTGREVHPDARDFAAEPGRLAQLQEYVRRWLPGLDAESPRPISCTYTSTPTGEFVLDRIGPVVVAAGFSGHGFKSAPAIGRVLADLALGAPAGAEPFALDAHAVLS